MTAAAETFSSTALVSFASSSWARRERRNIEALIRLTTNIMTGNSPEIAQVVLSPDFDPNTINNFDKHMFVLTRDADILFSQDGGETWSVSADLNMSGQQIMGEDLVISPAYNRSNPATQA